MSLILKFHQPKNYFTIEKNVYPPKVPELLAYEIADHRGEADEGADEFIDDGLVNCLLSILNPECEYLPSGTHVPHAFFLEGKKIHQLERMLFIAFCLGEEETRLRAARILSMIETPRAIDILEKAKSDHHTVRFLARAAIEDHKGRDSSLEESAAAIRGDNGVDCRVKTSSH